MTMQRLDRPLRTLFLTLALLAVSGIASAQGVTDMQKGKGGSEVQCSTGPGGTTGADGLERCSEPMGALAVVEPQDYVMAALAQYNLQSPTGIIRMMVQQSNCFIVVERGQAMNNMMQERVLSDSGELRQDSRMGGGQMVAADFILTPAVVFSDDDAGGLGGALGGLIGGTAGSIIGGVAGGLKFKEAQTSMLVSDSRTGVQVAAAEGSARKADLSLGGFMYGSGVGGALGGYSSTDEGKVIAASLADNYNNIVVAVRGQPSLHRDVGSLAEEAALGGAGSGGPVWNEGDIVWTKINNVKLMSDANDGSSVIAALQKTDDLIYMGIEENGFARVETEYGGGWVKKVLLAR
jgi:curli biogenesis system outer membrane secretion channel CsgG